MASRIAKDTIEIIARDVNAKAPDKGSDPRNFAWIAKTMKVATGAKTGTMFLSVASRSHVNHRIS